MNGITSTLQRRQGLNYKINFGVEIPRLKSIAHEYPKDKELATILWHDNIRECKLLAIFLLPQEHFSAIAEEWVTEAPFTEIADHLAMNILCKLPDATTHALKWAGEKKGLTQYCGYLTLTHILKSGHTLTHAEEELFLTRTAQLFTENSDSLSMRTAFTALCRYIDQSSRNTEHILAHTAPEGKLFEMVKSYIER